MKLALFSQKNDPLTLQFKNFGIIQSVGSIDHINETPVMSASPTSNAHSENSPTSIVDSMIDFNFLKGKIYKLKSMICGRKLEGGYFPISQDH